MAQRSNPFNPYYSGFTLVEMMLVIAIFIVLLAIGISGFSGLRETISISESTQNFQQDLRTAQRSALLLKRKPHENWIYGIGIDLYQLSDNNGQTANGGNERSYKMFKWCSPYTEYGGAATITELPNVLSSTDKSTMPSGTDLDSAYSTKKICDASVCPGNSTCKLIEITDNSFTAKTFPKPAAVMIDNNVRFILFESVTGRAFFYDVNGEIVNYEDSTYLIAGALPATVHLIGVSTKKDTTIEIAPVSGRMTQEVQSINKINPSLKTPPVDYLKELISPGGSGKNVQ